MIALLFDLMGHNNTNGYVNNIRTSAGKGIVMRQQGAPKVSGAALVTRKWV